MSRDLQTPKQISSKVSSVLLADFEEALRCMFINSGGYLKFFVEQTKLTQLPEIHEKIQNLYLEKINEHFLRYNLSGIFKAVVDSKPVERLPYNVLAQKGIKRSEDRNYFSVAVKIQLIDIEPAVFLDIPLTFYYQNQPTRFVKGYNFSHHSLDNSRDNFLDLLLSNPLKKGELYKYLETKVMDHACDTASTDMKVLTTVIERMRNALQIKDQGNTGLINAAAAAAPKTPPNVSLRKSPPTPTSFASNGSVQTRATPPQAKVNVRVEEMPNDATTEAHVTSLDDLISAETARLKKMSLSAKRAQVQLGRTIVYTKGSLDQTTVNLPFPSFNRIAVSEATLLYRYNKKYKLEKLVESMLDLYRDAKERHKTCDRYYSEFLKDALTQLSIERRCPFTAADIIALHNNKTIPENFSFAVKDDEEMRALFKSNQFVNYIDAQPKLGVREQIALLSRIDLRYTKESVYLPVDIRLYAIDEAAKFYRQPSNKTLKKSLLSAKKALDESEGEMRFKDKKNISYRLIRNEMGRSKLFLTVENLTHNFNYNDIYSLWLNARMIFDPTTKSTGLLDRIKNTVLRYWGGGFFFDKLEKDYPYPEENLSQIIHYAKNNPESLLAKSFRSAIAITIKEKAQYKDDRRRAREVSAAPPSVVETVTTQYIAYNASTASASEIPAAAPATQHTAANISQTDSHNDSTVSPPEMPLGRVSPVFPVGGTPMAQSFAAASVDQKTIFVAKREDEVTQILIDLRRALSSLHKPTPEFIDDAIKQLENQSITPGQKNTYILGNVVERGILMYLRDMSKCHSGENKQSVDRWISFFERVVPSISVAQNRGTASTANALLEETKRFLDAGMFGRGIKPAAAAAPSGSLHLKH